MKKYKLFLLLTSGFFSGYAFAACNLSYDANGSLIIDTQCNHYRYNAKAQLINLQLPNKHMQCRYTYSPAGLRDAKTCSTSNDQYMQLNYVYWHNHLINTKDGVHNKQSAYLGMDARYVISAFRQKTHYLTSAIHTTINVLLTSTVNLKQIYNFSSYGQNRQFSRNNSLNTINFSDPLSYNPLTYDGEYKDPETGFVYLKARFYDPLEMHFIQRDSYNLLDRYNAFDDNPVDNTDPTGHFSFKDLSLATAIASIGLGVLAPVVGILPEALPVVFALSGGLNIASTGLGMAYDHTTPHLAGDAMAMTGMALSTIGMMSSSFTVNFFLNLADNTLEGAAMPLMSSNQDSISAKSMGYATIAALPTAFFLAATSAYFYNSLSKAEEVKEANSWGERFYAPDASLRDNPNDKHLSVLAYAKPMFLGGIRTATAEYVRKNTFFPISEALGEHYKYTRTSLATNMLLGAAAGAYMYGSTAFINRNIEPSESKVFGEPRNKFLYNFTSSGWSVQFGLPTLESI
ncbi:RHS repeat-associated core domain-containing protein [Cysteiniphilum litorale]|uniref:RHS repeat-associated core domain-containing protein n=1 Tax=Cysteiniphilum litorale TaxID=2056700 RepID=UPI003F8807DC